MSQRFHFGPCVLDTATRELRRDGAPVALQARVFECLEYVIGHRDRAVSRGPGMGVWDVANLAAPAPVMQSPIDGFAGRHGVQLDGGRMLLQTATDLVHTLDVGRPAAPQQLATSWIPGGVLAVDAAMHAGRTVLVQGN